MSFELKRKEAVPDGIRRVIGERIDKAMAALNGDARKTPDDEAVHECESDSNRYAEHYAWLAKSWETRSLAGRIARFATQVAPSRKFATRK